MLTQLPGFPDPVHDSRKTFRALMDALARPGSQQTVPALDVPPGLVSGCGAAALTLLDLETTVWLQPGFSREVHHWLLFHTGCQFTDIPQTADFALIWDVATLPMLDSFDWGSPNFPETSTSLLLQFPSLSGGAPVTLRGPGIDGEITVQLPISANFWQQWQAMTMSFPLGIDLWCFDSQWVVGLPRTARPDSLDK